MKPIITTIVIALITAGLGFWSGTTYQKKKTPTFSFGATRNAGGGQFIPGGSGGATGAGRQAGGGLGGFINGQITAADSSNITIKEQNGSSRTVYLSSTSKVTKDAAATKDDLTIGTTVIVTGTPNSADNSVTATTVRISTP